MSQQTFERALIVGAGPIGLACALSAKRRGIDPLVIDAGAITNSILRYPIGMTFFTTPERLEIGSHPLVCAGQKPTREEVLKYYRGVVRTEALRVRTYTRLLAAERPGGGGGEGEGGGGLIGCRLRTRRGEEEIECERLVLATGYFDHPNLLGVEGESLPHVSHYFDEAHASAGRDVVVIGGKNSAVEAALELFRAGARVTLVYRGGEFRRSVKYWLKPDIENRIAAGEISACFGAEIVRITVQNVVVRTADGHRQEIPADRVYALTGFRPDVELFRRIGVEIDEDTGQSKLDRETLETNVAGVFMAGSITTGYAISDIFIENGRFDGEKIFGDETARRAAAARYARVVRPKDE